MKTNTLSLLAVSTLLLTAACASEDTTGKQEQKQENKTDGLTTFVMPNTRATRTTAEYDGSGIDFYWTEGDRLWVNNGTLIQDTKNNISSKLVPNPTTPTAVKRAATASFSFAGNYTAPNYPVRYTGKNSTTGDKVTIKAQQNQTTPNDASHLGESGDCGTATAYKTYTAEGVDYRFTLDHKASYLTLLPYSTINFSAYVKLTQIKITADEALSGQFDFDDSGIDLGSRPAPTPTNRSITLTLNGGGTNGFKLPIAAKKEDNASVIVLPPGTYHNVTIEYSVYDQYTTKSVTFKREYPTLALTAGKNKKISTDLKQIKVYYAPASWWVATMGPNTNEALWYVQKGDPHLDLTAVYAVRRVPTPTMPASICSGGVWFKKRANIPGFATWSAPDGTNKVGYNNNSNYFGYSTSLPQGVPANIGDYFFAPSVLCPTDNDSRIGSGNGRLLCWCSTKYEYNGTVGQTIFVRLRGKQPPIIGLNGEFYHTELPYFYEYQ